MTTTVTAAGIPITADTTGPYYTSFKTRGDL